VRFARPGSTPDADTDGADTDGADTEKRVVKASQILRSFHETAFEKFIFVVVLQRCAVAVVLAFASATRDFAIG
jgi:hypothetical protein